MIDYEYQSAEITLRFEVRRNRPSVTQGSASVYINGEKVITFGDEIEIIKPGERYYGELIGDWGSRKPDANFIRGLLFHPYDGVYHYSDSVKKIIDALCEAECPGKIRVQGPEGGSHEAI